MKILPGSQDCKCTQPRVLSHGPGSNFSMQGASQPSARKLPAANREEVLVRAQAKVVWQPLGNYAAHDRCCRSKVRIPRVIGALIEVMDDESEMRSDLPQDVQDNREPLDGNPRTRLGFHDGRGAGRSNVAVVTVAIPPASSELSETLSNQPASEESV